jgi:hypothetical protein
VNPEPDIHLIPVGKVIDEVVLIKRVDDDQVGVDALTLFTGAQKICFLVMKTLK